MYAAEELRRIADRIDKFPKYIRRDAGSTSVRQQIIDGLAEIGYENDPALVDFVDELTEKYRQTVVSYYVGQFANAHYDG